MRIEIDRSRASQPFALPTGQSHTIQLTVNVVYFHGTGLAFPSDETYCLVSEDGSYRCALPSSAARPVDEFTLGLAFCGLPRGQRFSLYRTSGATGIAECVFAGRSLSEMTTGGPA